MQSKKDVAKEPFHIHQLYKKNMAKNILADKND